MLTRWLAVAGIVLLIGLGAWLGLPEANKGMLENGNAASFSLPDLQGKIHGLPEGEVVLLNFWLHGARLAGKRCLPCQSCIASMQKKA